MNIPKDPVMLLSFVNTQLRDNYPSLEEFCRTAGISAEELCKQLAVLDYHYDKELNKFI